MSNFTKFYNKIKYNFAKIWNNVNIDKNVEITEKLYKIFKINQNCGKWRNINKITLKWRKKWEIMEQTISNYLQKQQSKVKR